MSTTRRWQAAAAMRERVDLPTPGIPTSTMEARESNVRRQSVDDQYGAGVSPRDRGDERALGGVDSSSRSVANVRFVPRITEGIVVWCTGVLSSLPVAMLPTWWR
jgi:hypothetical protein